MNKTNRSHLRLLLGNSVIIRLMAFCINGEYTIPLHLKFGISLYTILVRGSFKSLFFVFEWENSIELISLQINQQQWWHSRVMMAASNWLLIDWLNIFWVSGKYFESIDRMHIANIVKHHRNEIMHYFLISLHTKKSTGLSGISTVPHQML